MEIKLIVFMFWLVHRELLLNITFLMRYSYEELVEFGKCFVGWLRETNPYIKLPENAVSTWFGCIDFGKDYDVCRALCQKGVASR